MFTYGNMLFLMEVLILNMMLFVVFSKIGFSFNSVVFSVVVWAILFYRLEEIQNQHSMCNCKKDLQRRRTK